MKNKLYTIGHSNLSFEAFAALLSQHGIQTVVDVRSSPYSRYLPWVNKDVFSTSLRASGFGYLYGGDVLGGRAPYALDHVSFVGKLNRLVERSQESTCVMLCAEKDPKACHRAFKLSHALHSQAPELEILHIVSPSLVLESRQFEAQQKAGWAFK